MAKIIDKNSLWGEMNMQKWELCVKVFYRNIWGVVGVFFRKGLGEFGD
jgi:hypothetical protein